MKKEQKQKELDKLIQRVIDLKNNLYGEGNWKVNLLPTTIEGCNFYIQYCKDNYYLIG